VAGATVTDGDSNTITMSDTLANLNSALQLLTFTANDGFSGAATIEVRSNDLAGVPLTDTSTDVKTLTINVSDSVINIGDDFNINANTPDNNTSYSNYVHSLTGSDLITLTDQAPEATEIHVRLVASEGRIVVSDPGGLTNFNVGSGDDNIIELSGTATKINEALATLTLTPKMALMVPVVLFYILII
jgi:hypothetical protein